jgi:hypothetical protein
VLTRYSKAPEHAYTPNVRAEVLRDSRRLNSDEIRKGMDWLERQARSDSAVAEIMNGDQHEAEPQSFRPQERHR